MPERRGGKRRVLAAVRRKRAFELRVAGASYSQIAEELGITKQAVSQHIYKALDELAESSKEDIEKVRQIERQRIEAMILGLWPQARRGDVQAIDRVVRLQSRRARMDGLDAPAKQQISGDPDNPVPVVTLYLPQNGKTKEENES